MSLLIKNGVCFLSLMLLVGVDGLAGSLAALGSIGGPMGQVGVALQQLHHLQQLQRFSKAVNVSDLAAAGGRVARELSKSLNTDVVAVGKALAGAGAALGSFVFLGGMGALLATGLGAFKYAPGIYDQAGIVKTDKGVFYNAARTAKSFQDVKRPSNPELVPALNDLLTKVYEAVENGVPQLLERLR
ncbi:uncharacterized protein LOC111261922 [Varroa jacobsoni]|uniref:Uncharacterized protein n=1 Tax=Varroa destructor TaxID=109461 RepID=A0A7M7KL58_VARDE|nr:uncharacterized protein LOC111253434 [Varroa destructor]XP_022691542.1 uncharacterized protein LOC111261922 [Varroa jacobsoni]